MNSIRCAFVASYYGPYYSNFVASVLAREEEFKKKNFFSIYILPIEAMQFEWIGLLKEKNGKIYFIKYAPYSFHNLKELRKIIKKEKVNIIYSQMCGWDITAHWAAWKTPIVWHMDMGVDVTSTKKKIKNWIKYNILGKGKVFPVAVSYPVRDAINSLKPKNKCVAIPNALDFGRLEIANKIQKNGSKKILIFGWQPYVKGLDILLEACERLNNCHVQYNVLISAQDATYSFLEERYTELPTWVNIIPPTNNVAELYNHADIMISASRTEGFSFCLAEAIYMGLPVIFSNIPGTSWANEFKNTYEFKSEDVDSLIGAIDVATKCNVIEDDLDYNRRLMVEKYSLETWVQKEVNLIEKIVNG